MSGTPLYLVFGDKSIMSIQTNHRTFIGLCVISLEDFAYLFNNPRSAHHANGNSQIKGWYPILNVSGHVIGNVRLRVFLRHVQPENSNQSALNTTYVSTDLSKHFPSINCKNCNMSSVSLLHDHEVQVSKQQSERSTQTEYDTKEVFRPSSPSIKIHLYNELNETAKTTEYYMNRNVNMWQKDNLDIAPIQPAALCFSHTNETVKSCHCEAGCKRMCDRGPRPLSHILSRSQTCCGDSFIGQKEQLSSSVRETQTKLFTASANDTTSSSKGVRSRLSTCRPQLKLQKHEMDMKHLRKLALPKHVPPPPGKMVPKNRGWLRSTPVYRGPAQSSLVPKLTLTHFLRVQKNKSSIVQCVPSADKEQKTSHNRTIHSQRQSLLDENDKPVRKLHQNVGKVEDMKQTHPKSSVRHPDLTDVDEVASNLSPPEDSASSDECVTNSRRSENEGDIYHISNNDVLTVDLVPSNLKQSKLANSQNESSVIKESKCSTNACEEYITSSSSSSAENLQSEDFLLMQPKQSNLSPQISKANSHILQKCREQTRQLNKTVEINQYNDYDGEADDGGCSSKDRVDNLNESSIENSQISTNTTNNRNVGYNDDDIGNEVDLISYSDDYEDSQDTETISAELGDLLSPDLMQSKYEDNSKQKLESISLDGTTRMTSFTKVTAPLDSRLIHGGFGGTAEELLIDTNAIPTTSGTDNVDLNDDDEVSHNVIRLSPTTVTEFPQSNSNLVEDLGIEAMRSRNPKDYILGGTVAA
nr:unnamed protein product [Trichobilharzia regenti]